MHESARMNAHLLEKDPNSTLIAVGDVQYDCLM